MSEMIERMARAMRPKWFDGSEAGEPYREAARADARAALEAMKEPTEEMYVAWIENTERVADAEPTGRDQLAACKSDWQAMLSAAMGEEE